jgi:hypothetical protein
MRTPDYPIFSIWIRTVTQNRKNLFAFGLAIHITSEAPCMSYINQEQG